MNLRDKPPVWKCKNNYELVLHCAIFLTVHNYISPMQTDAIHKEAKGRLALEKKTKIGAGKAAREGK